MKLWCGAIVSALAKANDGILWQGRTHFLGGETRFSHFFRRPFSLLGGILGLEKEIYPFSPSGSMETLKRSQRTLLPV